MPDLSDLSYIPEDKYEISVYFSWDKDFIALAKKSIQIMTYIFFLFLEENIFCRYSLEVPHRDTSNEYPQHMFSLRNQKTVNFRASNSWLDKWILTNCLWTSNKI